ncbi:tyrosine-type recombinase/integrase [Devosia sediminis]|uniref:Tyrosine-type recombinase/integrase n=1 Tax=Devosia sediminis TaxID=2798801 RepID=A0A934MKJ4_9HYPH|nr:tyrosine-type recombinase/integrase [Devosia sediminis]MBJ3784185.1 tyrosine-type recombinase/integrase [Devosia sediminis]
MTAAEAIPRLHRVKRITYPSNGERSVLIEGPPCGIGHEASSLYVVACLRAAGQSPNSMYQQLLAVSLLLDWASHSGINVEQRTGSCNLFTRAEVLSLKDALRTDMRPDRRGHVVSPSHFVARCLAVKDYVVWHTENAIFRMRSDDVRRTQSSQILDNFIAMITTGLPTAQSGEREGLDEEVQELFLQAIHPESPLNPFQEQHRVRNYALLLLYWEKGSRRGENLKIKVSDLYLVGDNPKAQVRAHHDDPLDTRRIEPRVKTNERDLDISEKLRAAIEAWLGARTKYPRSKKCPYLFISRTGSPLAADTVNDMFRLLRSRVKGLPADLVTHHLRHSANDRFSDYAEAAGMDEAEERLVRNYMFGWNKNSSQGERYSRRSTRKKAQKAALAMQSKLVEGGNA